MRTFGIDGEMQSQLKVIDISWLHAGKCQCGEMSRDALSLSLSLLGCEQRNSGAEIPLVLVDWAASVCVLGDRHGPGASHPILDHRLTQRRTDPVEGHNGGWRGRRGLQHCSISNSSLRST